jgi:hypothetical protein
MFTLNIWLFLDVFAKPNNHPLFAMPQQFLFRNLVTLAGEVEA